MRYSKPFIRANSDFISLHFNSAELQSRMRVGSPNDLVVPYTKTMMGFLLAHPHPKNILMVGLGGGSLAKYCFHHLTDAKITVVEVNPHVIQMRDRFFIPQDCDRFKIVCADAAVYILDAKQEYDVILLDGFDIDGQVTTLCSSPFLVHCLRVMTSKSVIAVNLDAAHPAYPFHLGRMHSIFDGRILEVQVPDRDNRIVFGAKNIPLEPVYMSLSDTLGHHSEEVRNHLRSEFQNILLQLDNDFSGLAFGPANMQKHLRKNFSSDEPLPLPFKFLNEI